MAVSVASWLAGWLLADWVVVCYNQYCINERIEHKLLSLIYKALTTAQPTYLHSLISVQPPRATRSSSVVTLFRPPTSITNRSFRYASPHQNQ